VSSKFLGGPYENSTLLKDRKTVKARALPMPKPIVWAVEAYDKF
jgi:hypothetical protein